MTTSFLLYGASGYVGEAAAQLAVAQGLRPILAGRDAAKLEPGLTNSPPSRWPTPACAPARTI
jgi:short subunit dehydrogenase-like uncharacterized protein